MKNVTQTEKNGEERIFSREKFEFFSNTPLPASVSTYLGFYAFAFRLGRPRGIF